ncbi:hypothetical protein NF865_07870 [Thermococcus aggregans]|uniref:Uncharacterized protein n=1 Tax=Thermococcus aggregans TaxID=110163 RepID=A0A9E7SN40_THEAG|nr:hypothetical protein [Thermococcus aggregans]USS40238.1 hypothetical protein NF865_07870 [Thermococcus aggregans]
MKTVYVLFSVILLAIGVGVLNILVPLRELNYLTLVVLVSLIFLRAALPKRFKNRVLTFLWNFATIFLIGSLIYPYNKHLAYSYFAGAGVAATFYAFTDKLLYYGPQIPYFWVGLAVGFVLTTLLIGKLVNYKPFSKRFGEVR